MFTPNLSTAISTVYAKSRVDRLQQIRNSHPRAAVIAAEFSRFTPYILSNLFSDLKLTNAFSYSLTCMFMMYTVLKFSQPRNTCVCIIWYLFNPHSKVHLMGVVRVTWPIFTARGYASAVYAAVQCLSVRLSVRLSLWHKSEF